MASEFRDMDWYKGEEVELLNGEKLYYVGRYIRHKHGAFGCFVDLEGGVWECARYNGRDYYSKLYKCEVIDIAPMRKLNSHTNTKWAGAVKSYLALINSDYSCWRFLASPQSMTQDDKSPLSLLRRWAKYYFVEFEIRDDWAAMVFADKIEEEGHVTFANTIRNIFSETLNPICSSESNCDTIFKTNLDNPEIS